MDQNDNSNVYAPPQAQVADPTPEPLTARPQQIVVAVWVLWIASILGVVMSFVNLFALNTLITSQRIVSQILMWIIILIVNGWIIYCINSGKNWARILKLITSSFSFAGLVIMVLMKYVEPQVYSHYFRVLDKQPAFSQVVSWINLILLLVAMWLLFTRPGSDWFHRKTS